MENLKKAALNRALISLISIFAGLAGSYLLEFQPAIHAALCKVA